MNDLNCVYIGMQAPEFTALTTMGIISMSDYKGKWLVFFSHPGDFTPVCTTEFIAFAQVYPDFQALNTELLGLSIDSNPSHLDWVYNIFLTTGVEIPFPIVADRVGDIANLYGMVPPVGDNANTVRNVYIIDPNQIIRAVLAYPNSNGRNIQEILRLVEALQFTDREGLYTPANWRPGQPGMLPVAQTYQELIMREQGIEGLHCNAWYWCYKEPDGGTMI